MELLRQVLMAVVAVFVLSVLVAKLVSAAINGGRDRKTDGDKEARDLSRIVVKETVTAEGVGQNTEKGGGEGEWKRKRKSKSKKKVRFAVDHEGVVVNKVVRFDAAAESSEKKGLVEDSCGSGEVDVGVGGVEGGLEGVGLTEKLPELGIGGMQNRSEGVQLFGEFLADSDASCEVDSPVVEEIEVDSLAVEENLRYLTVVEEKQAFSPIMEENSVDSSVVKEIEVDSLALEENPRDSEFVEENQAIVEENLVDSPVVEESLRYSPVLEENQAVSPIVEENPADSPIMEQNQLESSVSDGNQVDSPTGKADHDDNTRVELVGDTVTDHDQTLQGKSKLVDQKSGKTAVNAGNDKKCVQLLCDDNIDEEEKEREGLVSDEEDSDEDWEGVERSDLEKVFAMAANYGMVDDHLRSLESDLQMQLYGLHKVALEGPCHEAQPMALKVAARAKWNAWQRLGNMNPDEAMEQYINLLSEKLPGWSQRICSVGVSSSEPNTTTILDTSPKERNKELQSGSDDDLV